MNNLMTTEQRATWLEARRESIGASDVAAIIGLSRWRTPWDVWADKTGRLEEWGGNEATWAGQRFEGAVLDYAEAELGPLARNVRMQASGSLPLAATLDAQVIENKSPVEAKTTGIVGPVYGNWGESLTDEVPDEYLVQVHAQLICTQSEIGYLFAMIAGRGVVEYRIEPSPSLHEMIGNVLSDWWEKHVVFGIEPPITQPVNLEVVKRLRRVPKKVIVADLQLESLINLRHDYKAEMKSLDTELRNCEAKILLRMADAEQVDLSDGSKLTYFERTRKAYEVQASTYRQFQLARPKENK